MTLPKSLTTVTTFSKILALVLFIMLPFIGFIFGMEYQQKIDNIQPVSNPTQSSNPSPSPPPTPKSTLDISSWKTYEGKHMKFKYPEG